MHHFSIEQRRARLAWRHRLVDAARAVDPDAVARSLLAVHATDPASMHLSAVTRMVEPDVAQVERALYERRSLVRMLGMRRTVFAVPVELAAVVHAACTRDIAARERRNLLRALRDSGIGDAPRWLEVVEAATLAALTERRAATAAELTDDVAELRHEMTLGSGRWTTTIRAGSRVLYVLAADGRIVRGRPRGTWLSTQYRWATTETWLGGVLQDLQPAAARTRLARRWLTAFGPATGADLQWWSGWTKTQTRAALDTIDTVEVDLDGVPGIVLADDLEPAPAAPPAAALLPALDATPMGWSERSWYLGDHGAALFDRSGNIGPTVWWDGRIVGGWAQRSNGTIVHRLLADVGSAAVAAIEAAAARLQPCMSDVTVTPRFRTPLERELSAR